MVAPCVMVSGVCLFGYTGMIFPNNRARMGNNRDLHTRGPLMEYAEDDIFHITKDLVVGEGLWFCKATIVKGVEMKQYPKWMTSRVLTHKNGMAIKSP